MLRHDDYETATCECRIPGIGGDSPVSCKLTPKPREGSILGTVKNVAGEPVTNLSIDVTGPKPANVTVDAQGAFALKDVPPGRYQLRIDTEDYLLLVTSLEVPVRGEATASLVLTRRPKNAARTRATRVRAGKPASRVKAVSQMRMTMLGVRHR